MTLFSLLYASRSLVPPEETDAALAALVDVSRSRNAAAQVTGCLICGAGRFAQILEGERHAVEAIMHSILQDQRHTEVAILEQGNVLERRFAGWALGYAGPSLFVGRTIARPVAEALRGSGSGIADLVRIMTRFYSDDDARK
jgi:hypothetical protein